jgi:O-acetyl-ADP-ribose deacetylase (regulator of RNase III)
MNHPHIPAGLAPVIDRLTILTGDITALPLELGVAAIVNAANESLLGGGGVDGAIHRAAGPRLLAHNEKLHGCPTGLAVLTPAFDLAEKTNGQLQHIIHAVGPVWPGDERGAAQLTQKLGHTPEDVLLASCYQQSLQLAADHRIPVLAFPAISTGVYGFPKDRAAQIAIGHVLGFLQQHDTPARVIFCCFRDPDADLYRATLHNAPVWLFNRPRA